MTKTPTGRPTGEAYLQLETEADTQLAKVSKLIDMFISSIFVPHNFHNRLHVASIILH